MSILERVKAALPGVPVGYVDAYFLFEKHPRITDACDVVMTNCYPFWEGCPRAQALAYMQSMLASTRAAAPGKRVLISETGWPDQGSAFHASVPSAEGAMAYFIDTLTWAAQDGLEVVYIAGFAAAGQGGGTTTLSTAGNAAPRNDTLQALAALRLRGSIAASRPRPGGLQAWRGSWRRWPDRRCDRAT